MTDIPARNLARLILDTAESKPGLRLGTADDQLSLKEAIGLAAGRAHELVTAEIGPRSRVAIAASTSTDYLLTWLACVFAGAQVALVNATYPYDLIEDMLVPLRPTRLLGETEVARARSVEPADVDGLPGLDADLYDVVSFMHTSGTTGLPKFCAQTHDYFRRMAMAVSAALELTPDDRVFAPLPLFHINPMGYGVITSLLTGSDVLSATRFSASSFWPTVVEEHITVLVLHAPPIEILKRATRPEDARGHRIRTMFYADGDFLESFSIPGAVSGYGSTEAGGISHLRSWWSADEIPPDASRHGGRGRDDIEWKVDDDGSIFVRERERAALFDGYVREGGVDPARDAQGWFDTGDLGHAQDPDYLVFLERAAESIRVKGEFVPIPFVESHLAGIQGLTDHALWKRRGELVDDEVVLYAVCGDGFSVDELRSKIAALPVFMRPVVLACIDEIPRDAAAGKAQRRLLDQVPVRRWIELV